MHVGHCMCARRQTLHAHTHACVRACTHGCTSATASHTRMHGGHDARFWHACRPFMARMHVSMHAHIHMLACSNTCANTLAFIHTHTHHKHSNNTDAVNTLLQYWPCRLLPHLPAIHEVKRAMRFRGNTGDTCLNCRWVLLLLLFEREVLDFILR